jgi:hypothetical protein
VAIWTIIAAQKGTASPMPTRAGQASIPGERRANKIEGQFIPRLVEMMESPAWRVLSLSARRCLDRIELEHAHHGGRENGRLPVTYDQFVQYGVHRHAIGPALRELQALGFVEVTEHGVAGNAEHRTPNRFRLTYCAAGRARPTNEWRRITTLDEAAQRAAQARAGAAEPPRRSRVTHQKAVPEFATARWRKPSPEQATQYRDSEKSPVLETVITSISPPGRRGGRGAMHWTMPQVWDVQRQFLWPVGDD